MTTIILDQPIKTLFADTKETQNDGTINSCIKINKFYCNKKHIGYFGECGYSDEIESFKHYFNKLKSFNDIYKISDKKPSFKHLSGILCLLNGDCFYLSGSEIPIPITDKIFCIGAGAQMGYATLEMGFPAHAAYEVLGKRTNHTSRDFHSVKYTDPKAEIVYHENGNNKETTINSF